MALRNVIPLKRPEEEAAVLAADELLSRIHEAIERQLAKRDRMSVDGAYYLIVDAVDVAQEDLEQIRRTADHIRQRRGQAKKGPPPSSLINIV